MTALYSALLQQYINDPKLAHGLITNCVSWPPEDGLADLLRQADDLIAEATDLLPVFPYHPSSSVWIDQLLAARDALEILFAEELAA